MSSDLQNSIGSVGLECWCW